MNFRGAFYQQVFEIAMGSPVSVVVANLGMEDVEQRALSTFPTPPKFWKRYVDDVICGDHKNDACSRLQDMNSIELSLQFTY